MFWRSPFLLFPLGFLVADLATSAPLGEEWTMKPECAIDSKRYLDQHNRNFDLTARNSVICQQHCALNSSCEVFTYYPNTKSCWLQTEGSVLASIEDGADAIAGPRECMSITAITATTTTTGESSDWPWWAWLLCLTGWLCCLIAVGTAYYLMMPDRSEGKSKRKRTLWLEAPSSPAQGSALTAVPMQTYAPEQARSAPPVFVSSATPVSYAAPIPSSATYVANYPSTATYAMTAPAPGGSFVMAPLQP